MPVSFVCRTPRFDRTLRDLKSQGGQAFLIAEKAEQIVVGLFCGADISELGKQARHGEYRIDQCFKFDLGGGYCVVCLIHGECLILLYAGTHDDCRRWRERKKGLKYDRDVGRAVPVVKTAVASWTLPPEVEEERSVSEDYEEAITGRLDDNSLRRIFGLPAQSDCP
jgi:hypothetical protein